MVSSGGARPAALTQGQVDDLARGRHVDVARLLHAQRAAPPAQARGAEASGPVAMAPAEMQAIARTGTAPKGVLQRIAAAAPAEAARKGKPKSAASGKTSASAPALKPPDSAADA